MRYTKCLSSLINQLFRITLTSISCYFYHKDEREKDGKLLTKRCSSPTQMIFLIFPVNFALVDLLPFRMCLCLSARTSSLRWRIFCQSTLADFIKWQPATCTGKTAHRYFRICQQCVEISLTLCEVSGSHSRVAEDSGLLICYIMSTDKYLPMFRKIQVPLSSG